MADIEFIKKEFGDNYDFAILNKDGTTVDLTGYNGGFLTIVDPQTGNVLASTAITIPVANPAKARWIMSTAQTNIPAGNYKAQLEFTGTGVDKKTYILSVLVVESLT